MKKKTSIDSLEMRVIFRVFLSINILICLLLSACNSGRKDEYDSAMLLLENGYYEEAIRAFDQLGSYKDSAKKKLEAQDKLYGADYSQALSCFMNKEYDRAYGLFCRFGEYRESKKRAEECLSILFGVANELFEAEEYNSALEWYKWLAVENYQNSAERVDICTKAICDREYNAALALMESGYYEEAIQAFHTLNGYKDSSDLILSCKSSMMDRDYASAVGLKDAGKLEEAIKAFKALNGYLDSANQITACEMAIKDRDYAAAIALFDSSKYEKAIKAFLALKGYKDSTERLNEAKLMLLKNPVVGGAIYLGSYEQDANSLNGREDIEWIVLDKQGAKALVISKYALDVRPYHKELKSVTWETCTFRSWLNETFLSIAFSSEDQERIVTTIVSADNNPRYKSNPGNVTHDKLFLLSINEVKKYFISDAGRRCIGTAHAFGNTNTGYIRWWLRTPGKNQDSAAYVETDGSVNAYGVDVYGAKRAMRPAMWIKIG